MTAIEPGEKFTVGYGKGHKLEVVALTIRQQGKVLALLELIAKAEENREFGSAADRVEEALTICLGGDAEKAAALCDTALDLELGGDLIRSVLHKQELSEDEEKKSESPPS